MRGLDVYTTKDGFKVARTHFTADPEKDPEREGQEWLKQALKGIPGGKSSAMWRKEMEIDFTAYSGQLLCYNIINEHRSKIVKDIPILKHHFKYGSLDWGRNNPASFHTYVVDEFRHIHSAYEIYLRDTSIPDFCKLIKQSTYYQELLWISADPSLWNKNQETKEGLRSLENMFADNGIILRKSKSRDDQVPINELLDSWKDLDTKEPTYTISPRCHKQIWELERLRYREISTAMIENANNSEQLVDKDNHAWDDYKYFINTLFGGADSPETKPIPQPNSLAAHLEMYNQRKVKEFN